MVMSVFTNLGQVILHIAARSFSHRAEDSGVAHPVWCRHRGGGRRHGAGDPRDWWRHERLAALAEQFGIGFCEPVVTPADTKQDAWRPWPRAPRTHLGDYAESGVRGCSTGGCQMTVKLSVILVTYCGIMTPDCLHSTTLLLSIRYCWALSQFCHVNVRLLHQAMLHFYSRALQWSWYFSRSPAQPLESVEYSHPICLCKEGKASWKRFALELSQSAVVESSTAMSVRRVSKRE